MLGVSTWLLVFVSGCASIRFSSIFGRDKRQEDQARKVPYDKTIRIWQILNDHHLGFKYRVLFRFKLKHVVYGP